MGQWFYAEGNRQQRGPLASDELIALYRSSRIAADTLVWRDGMERWLPLRDVAEEIGLVLAPPPAASTPAPPLDATPGPAPAPRVAVPPQIPVPPTAPATGTAVAPRTGMSGCAIAALIGGACLVVGIAVVAILAAIALPAYQEYVMRTKTTLALAELGAVKAQVSQFASANGRCPVNDDDGFQAADGYASSMLAAVHIGRFDNGHCGIEAELEASSHAALDGKLVWLDYDPEQQQWECTSEVDDKYLPLECRG
ncbi:GYF domain-containing protein [Stenotrophomonas rhizophila]